AKSVLARLQPRYSFVLNGDGLPKNEKSSGWSAADAWACFAADDEGSTIAEGSHEELKQANVWVRRKGCSEQVTGTEDKGEDAIIEQEGQLRSMSADEIEQQMPAFKACFEWIRSL